MCIQTATMKTVVKNTGKATKSVEKLYENQGCNWFSPMNQDTYKDFSGGMWCHLAIDSFEIPDELYKTGHCCFVGIAGVMQRCVGNC